MAFKPFLVTETLNQLDAKEPDHCSLNAKANRYKANFSGAVVPVQAIRADRG
jgi:hypothetical protein